ncbi:MAG: S8 family serine peptidase [Pyrinomonadaceae bacterium]
MKIIDRFRLSVRHVVVTLSLIGLVAAFMSIGVVRPTAQDRPAAADFSRFYQSDAVTAAIRDSGLVPVRIPVSSVAARAAAQKLGPVIGDYGSYLVVAVPERTAAQMGPDAAVLETKVYLPGRNFDPLKSPPAGTVSGDGSGINGGGRDYYIVQLGGPTRDEWLDSLRAVGVEVLQYIPHQAFLVYGDGAAIQKVASHSRVRWVGRYLAEDKVSLVMREQIAAAKGAALSRTISPLEFTNANRARFDLAIFARADMNAVARQLMAVPGLTIQNSIKLPTNYFNVLRVEMPLDAVDQVAQFSDIIRIDSYSTPSIEDERSSQIISGNYTSTTVILPAPYNPLGQFGVDGTNVTVSDVDDGVSIPGTGGFYITATNTVDGPLRGSTSGASGGHGHINASIIAGDTPFSGLDPTGYNYGKGVANKANIINIPMLKAGYTGTEANAYNDTVITPGPNGVLGSISNNSWGNGTNSNVYDSYTAQFDGYVRDASAAGTIDPILLVFSAGNSGPGALSLTRPKASKNPIATGNSENLRTEISASANNMDDLTSSSSRGPTADGRVKPDITAPGTVITGSRAGTGTSVSGQVDANVSWSSGTSHAAPQIAGAAALFTQFWKANNGGVNPSPALVKAAILNTGQEMNGVNTGTALPNGNEGWGRINMQLMLNTGVGMKYVNQTSALNSPGDAATYTGKVADVTKPVRFMLVWTDPPAVADPALINNLDLTVTVGANTYKGNVFTNGLSVTGGTADTLNNVEAVRLAEGVAAGTNISITVSATALNGDGILGNADLTDQHFALVAYNFAASGGPVPSDFDGDRKSDVAVFRPATGSWYLIRSSNQVVNSLQFGANGDRITPADYDGDGKADIAVFRPSTGAWYAIRSGDNTLLSIGFGLNGDLPNPSDFDGDGKAEIAVFRPTSGSWYYLKSTTNYGTFVGVQFGANGDNPVSGDYDGDGKADIAVWRPSSGAWYVLRSSDGGVVGIGFGTNGDKPTVGDFDGDAKADFAVYRPTTGAWYALKSSTNNTTFSSVAFGQAGDIAAPGDFDGDGKTDQAVFRPATGSWYLLGSTAGFSGVTFGSNGDTPSESAYIP